MYSEINQHLEKAKKGHKESKQWLLEKLNPMIIAAIRKYYYRIKEYEDLLQEGRLVILQCITSYDESKGTYFLGYVKQKLMFYFLDKNKEKLMGSLNETLGEEDQLELIDLLFSDEEDALQLIIRLETRREIVDALLSLTPRQRSTILAFYYQGLSIDEIAKRQGVSYRTVVNTKQNSLKRLRSLLKEDSYGNQ